MKLSTKGRYAVTAMADIARQSHDRPVSLGDISERQGISLAYLEQLFGKLRRAGLVTSMRGPGGGYMLAREASGIAVAEIMAAVDERLQATQCSGAVGEGCTNDDGRRRQPEQRPLRRPRREDDRGKGARAGGGAGRLRAGRRSVHQRGDGGGYDRHE